MRGKVGRAAAGCILVVAAGCAAAAPTRLADRLVTRGTTTGAAEATFDVAAPEDAPAAPATPVVVPPELRRGAVPKFVAPNALEDTDRALGEALLALAAGESAPAHARVAAEYRRLRVFDRAEAHLTRAIGLTPRDAGLYEARARLWRDWGVPQRALPDAHRAIYFAPASAAAQNTLGTVLFALGQPAEARQRFARAVELAPDAAPFWSNLCYAAWAQEELDAARSACDEALRLAPDFEPARRNHELVMTALVAPGDRARGERSTEGTP